MKKEICAWCYYARMKTDICGIYCTGGFENTDGTCDHFKDSREARRRKDSMDDKKLIEALLCCVDRKCGECSYRGCGIACKYRLMREAASQLAEKDKQLAAERDAANSELDGICRQIDESEYLRKEFCRC